MIPLQQFKDIILKEQYKKCEAKTQKTWYNLMKEAFFDYMYKVSSINYNNLIVLKFPLLLSRLMK